MGRPPRLLLSGFPHHVVQRGHNRDTVFAQAADYEYYLANLLHWKRFFAVAVQAWCLMTNHVHLVLMPRHDGACISALMRRLSARQGRYVNRLERRLGTLWCGRFHSSVIDTNAYLLACLRYVELNPVRAGMVRHAGDYAWSSYRERMGLAPQTLLDWDPAMSNLGAGEEDCRRAYAQYLDAEVSPVEQGMIRSAVRRNQLTGDPGFIQEIERRTGLRLENRAPGRPPKNNKNKSGTLSPAGK